MKTFISYPDKEEKVEEIIKFEPISWAELEKKQVRPIEWLVEGVIPKPSLCLIASKGGVGKTLVTLEIVRQIIEGGMFLGKYQCKKSKSLEESKNVILSAFEDQKKSIHKSRQVITFGPQLSIDCECEAIATIAGRVLSIIRR